MTTKLNRCYFQAASAGTGDFVYDQTEAGFHSPVAASAVDGDSFYYIAEVLTAGVPTQWELGVGAWTTDTLTRSALESSNGGLAVDFTDPPKVRMGVPLAADFNPITLSDGAVGESYLITAGNGLAGNGGRYRLKAGNGTQDGGSFSLEAGVGAAGEGGFFELVGGAGETDGGRISLEGGRGNTGNGGRLQFTPGEGDVNGGDFRVTLPPAGSGRQGLALFDNLPTSDPGISGALWVDVDTIKISL